MSDVPDALQAALPDRYVLERVLGRGGMATVYLARDKTHGRNVAVKVLRPEVLSGLMDRLVKYVRDRGGQGKLPASTGVDEQVTPVG